MQIEDVPDSVLVWTEWGLSHISRGHRPEPAAVPYPWMVKIGRNWSDGTGDLHATLWRLGHKGPAGVVDLAMVRTELGRRLFGSWTRPVGLNLFPAPDSAPRRSTTDHA